MTDRIVDQRSSPAGRRPTPSLRLGLQNSARQRKNAADRSLEVFVNRLLSRSHLDDVERAAIIGLAWERERVAAGQELARFGARTNQTYLVEAGAIGRYSQMRNGARQIVAMHIAGEMADLCAVVLPRSSWCYQALIPSTVLRIAHADLLTLCERYPAIARAFWRDCIVDMEIISEWLVSIAQRPAESRLAHLMCELQCRYEQAGQIALDGSFWFPVTQAQLADILGMTSIHANRMVRSLREKGLATISKSIITVHDRSALERLAEFSPDYLHFPRGEHAISPPQSATAAAEAQSARVGLVQRSQC